MKFVRNNTLYIQIFQNHSNSWYDVDSALVIFLLSHCWRPQSAPHWERVLYYYTCFGWFNIGFVYFKKIESEQVLVGFI